MATIREAHYSIYSDPGYWSRITYETVEKPPPDRRVIPKPANRPRKRVDPNSNPTAFRFQSGIHGAESVIECRTGWGAVLSCDLFGMAHAFGFSHGSFSFDIAAGSPKSRSIVRGKK